MLSLLNRMRLWLRAALFRRRFEREMQEEMAEHLRRSTERLMMRGLSARAARREAEREFGNVPYLQDEAREARGTAWLDALRADVRFAVRHFGRTPLTTLTMFIVLALGMSISTLLFTYVHAYATMPPPAIERAEDLVRIRGSRSVDGGRMYRTFAVEELNGYRALGDHFAAVAGWTDELVALGAAGGGEEAEARASFVTEDYFPVLGVGPAAGRTLPVSAFSNPAEAAVVVISHAAWETLFGGDPEVIGRTTHVNGVAVTIVGVAREHFRGIAGFSRFHVWLPLQAHALVVEEPPLSFRAAARLKPGVSVAEASAAVEVVAGRSAATDAESRLLEPSADVVPLLAANGDPMFERDVRLLAVAVGLLGLLVLIVTCTNVSALLTGLATARRQEIAVRLSLGAARRRLIRQLLTESALLACMAAAAALGIVWLALSAVTRHVHALPLTLRINVPVTLFTFGVALAVGIAFGLSPALHATRLALASAMRDSAANLAAMRGRLQRTLVVAQIAFTQPLIVLLAALLVFVVSDVRPRRTTELGDRLISVSLHFTQSARDDAAALARLRLTVQDLLEDVRAVPGVQHAIPDLGGGEELGAYVPHPADAHDTPRAPILLDPIHTEPGYFDMLGVRVLRGRDFTPAEITTSTAPEVPVIIGAELARTVWGDADPVGRRLRATTDSAHIRELRVVGVVADPLTRRRANEPWAVYMPADTMRIPTRILARTEGPGVAVLGSLRQLAGAQTPTGMRSQVRTLAEINEEHERRFRIVTGSISAAGMMALLLSAIGLYAVVAFGVTQRTREIAVRMAVGGRSPTIIGSFVLDGLRLSALGLAIGLPLSLIGLRALMLIPDIPRVELPYVTLIAALGVTIVATLASWIPARRAATVQPAVALRSD